ncbi:hypothetical protein BV25DRAFT_1872792 [Artomyces pyxidatus]|uniref:Uncharacterized protein n=1 Tax=Artomyces pyxidatus TaxID=48021 RepID=A0ACB8SJ10_9AGAM|nr:hypothetical protein BV25DRAFT_1872792 [Artomyces pyxidatus]
MEAQQATSKQPYTILRIKRKRTEEPLDALVIESRVRRKKSRGGLDIFQFAETVGPEEFRDERRTRDLQKRISALAREQAIKNDRQAAAAASPTPSQLKTDAPRTYTIVPQDTPEPQPRIPLSPPKVLSAKDLEQKPKTDFKLYDAVLAPSAEPASPDPDYVWDVFYHRAGLLNEYDGITNVATLTGLPASFADPYMSDSESEEEDEADEDSNAEEYYKNDYPDEESSEGDSDSNDMFHEASEDGEEHDWR